MRQLAAAEFLSTMQLDSSTAWNVEAGRVPSCLMIEPLHRESMLPEKYQMGDGRDRHGGGPSRLGTFG